MLRTSSAFIIIAISVGCTSTPIAATDSTKLPGTTEPSPIEDLAMLPPGPTATLYPTTEPDIGELLWTFRPGSVNEPPLWVSPISSATASNGVLYVGASDCAGRGWEASTCSIPRMGRSSGATTTMDIHPRLQRLWLE